MSKGVVMENRIKEIVDSINKNPHWLSQKSNLTYRIVLKLCKSDTIPETTSIGTLQSIASALDVRVDDLYTLREND